MRGLFLSLIFLWTFDSFSECRKLHEHSLVQECHLLVPSKALQDGRVYVKAWIPDHVHAQTRIILFLHGRGYAHSKDSAVPTMIEAAGLEEGFDSEAYMRNPAIILSPQDLFIQDGNRVGNDYWLGADGRDWEKFFTEELKPFIEKKWKLEASPWLTLGISMGAHGAMKLALDYPSHFEAFAAISPVFRSSSREIEEFDEDVFYAEKELSRRSLGARLLSDARVWHQLRRTPHWIDIHQSDFALGHGFPDSTRIWPALLRLSKETVHSHVEVVGDDLQAAGHSMTYWRMRLPLVLDWLLTYEQDL